MALERRVWGSYVDGVGFLQLRVAAEAVVDARKGRAPHQDNYSQVVKLVPYLGNTSGMIVYYMKA